MRDLDAAKEGAQLCLPGKAAPRRTAVGGRRAAAAIEGRRDCAIARRDRPPPLYPDLLLPKLHAQAGVPQWDGALSRDLCKLLTTQPQRQSHTSVVGLVLGLPKSSRDSWNCFEPAGSKLGC